MSGSDVSGPDENKPDVTGAPPDDTDELLFYQTEDGQGRIQLRLHNGTVWLTQRLLAELYQVSVKTVNGHLINIYDDAELDPAATIRKFRIVQIEGGRVRKGDVSIAKNYLSQSEMSELNRIVVMYLDYAEDQARRRSPLYTADWRQKLDAFLAFNDREILDNAGKVAMEVARQLARDEYDLFHQHRLQQDSQDELDTDTDSLISRIKPHKSGQDDSES